LPNSYRFPAHYPAGCPPVDTELCDDYLYLVPHADRLPRKKDFRSYFDRGLGRDLPDSEGCSLRGVSIHQDIADLERILKLYPGKAERCVVKLRLPGGHGIVKHTPSAEGGDSHHDWWIPVGVDPSTYFESHVGGPYP
jgi:hypothetical protein